MMLTPAWFATILLAMVILAEAQFAYQKPGQIELLTPSRPPGQSTLLVKCYEESIEVIVQADLYDIGVLVDGRDLHLGYGSVADKGSGDPCGAVPSGHAQFTIHAGLTDCGTQLSSTETELVYSNVLVYSPEPSPDGLLRLDGTTIPIKCLYHKRYGVDSAALSPNWVSFTSTASAEDQLDFTLRLMTDDGLLERGSNVYFLGEHMHLEAAVVMGNHMPLRVYVDNCVATVTPEVSSSPRYEFIQNHGCLTDAQLTSSGSHFLPRSQDDKLHFVLDAFRFHQVAEDSLYITCFLKALPAMLPLSSRNRACSFTDNRWHSADDTDEACGSCDVFRRLENPAQPSQTLSHHRSRPSTKTDRPKQNPTDFLWARPGQQRVSPQKDQRIWPPSHNTRKRGTESERGWSKTAHIGPLTILDDMISQPSVQLGPLPEVTQTTVSMTTAPQETAGHSSIAALLVPVDITVGVTGLPQRSGPPS